MHLSKILTNFSSIYFTFFSFCGFFMKISIATDSMNLLCKGRHTHTHTKKKFWINKFEIYVSYDDRDRDIQKQSGQLKKNQMHFLSTKKAWMMKSTNNNDNKHVMALVWCSCNFELLSNTPMLRRLRKTLQFTRWYGSMRKLYNSKYNAGW